MKIAMCQIVALDSDREGNFVRIESAIKEAGQQQADLVCFPETTILGWVNPMAHERAYPIPGKDTERLAKLAQQYDVHVCAGLAEKVVEKLYDAAVLIDDQGRILLKHRKINTLPHLMTPPYTPGQEVQVVRTKFGVIGLLICADSFKESVCERMGKLKPDLVLIPYGWAAKEAAWPEHGDSLRSVVQKAARSMHAPVIGTDGVGQISSGPWKGMVYGGLSVAATAQGEVIAIGKDRQHDIKVISLPLKPQSVL
ncbi:MAG: carbon-nitrogen hydrolase family protein [Phycisphaeraceae bacterium]|nr:carbon-nitrogen hydrolase family protein [Phycisphaeraceae bacterium]